MKAKTLQIIVLGFSGCWILSGCGGDVSEPLDSTSEALEAFVDAAMHNEIDVDEARETYESLSDKEKQTVAELVLKNLGTSVPSAIPNPDVSEVQQPGQQAAGAVWQQPIENAWTVGYPPGSKFASSWYVDWNCDNDPSDKEYVFKFGFPASSPSGIRWTSNSSQVYLAFITAYGGNLLGFGYSFSEARLCIGDNGVNLAGGPANVMANVFIHY